MSLSLLKKLLAGFAFFCGMFLLPGKASACHCAAADIYVVYTGAGLDGCTGTTEYKYDVFVNMYFACQTCDNDPGANASVRVRSATAGYDQNIPLTDLDGMQDTVHSLCPVYNDSNSCKHVRDTNYTNRFPGFRLRTYVGSWTLPSAQTDWVFSYSTGARNDNVNITNCNSQQIWVEAMLNNVTKYNNSTPRFTENPLPYICINQPTSYLNGPYDLNGDSMQVYQQEPYTNSSTTQCFFTVGTPFSLADPIGSAASNPYVLNPTTGAATFTPIQGIGQYLLAFRVEDYERGTGVKLSHVYRDVQVSVLPCTEPPPGIDSLSTNLTVVNGTVVPVTDGSKAIVTCPGNNLNFTLTSKSFDPTHTVYMYANTTEFPGSNFTVTGAGTQSVSGTFTWTPTPANIGEHTLTITSADSTCNAAQPIVLRSYTVIYIKVINGLDAGRDLATCKINPPGRQLSVKGYGNLVLNFKWTDISGGPAKNLNADDIPNPISTARTNTSYVVFSPELKDKCKARDTVLVYEDTSNTIDIFPQTDRFVMCRPGYLQLDAVINGRGPIDNMMCGTNNIQTCDKYDSVVVWGSPSFGTGIAIDTTGPSAPILETKIYSTKYQYLIRKDEFKEYGLRSATMKALSVEVTGNKDAAFIYGNFTVRLGCTDKTELTKTDGFEEGLVTVYTNAAGQTLPNGWNKFSFDQAYNWDTTKNLIVQICYSDNPVLGGPCTGVADYPPIMKFMPTSYISGMELRAQSTATKSVCDVKSAAAIKEFATRPVFQFDYCEAPGLPFLYMWTPGNYLSDSTIREPLAYVPQTTNYAIRTYGRNGCIIADTLQVYVPVHDFSVYPRDTAICFGESFKLEVRKGTYYQWYEYENGEYKPAIGSVSCDMCADPMVSPKKNTHYKIMVGDDVFCYDTIDAYVEVRPLPLVNILTPDTTIKYGQSVQLLVNGARLYNWSPVSSLNNPNISYPVATPTEPTMYVVTGLGTNGCRAMDTVRVNLDYRDRLLIPTAFSPNGDGKNDMFRIPNLTFQRVVEFRIFNRWGQEIFSGGDPKKGWDGNWKGVPQEIGSYQYMIRVAYPDGYVETYKGDVTLLR